MLIPNSSYFVMPFFGEEEGRVKNNNNNKNKTRKYIFQTLLQLVFWIWSTFCQADATIQGLEAEREQHKAEATCRERGSSWKWWWGIWLPGTPGRGCRDLSPVSQVYIRSLVAGVLLTVLSSGWFSGLLFQVGKPPTWFHDSSGKMP